MNNKETRTLENSNKHIDNWLSQQFEDFTPNPDAGLWQSIDSALDRKERRSKFIWYWLAAGVLLLVVGVGIVQWNSNKNRENQVTSVAAQEKTGIKDALAPNKKPADFPDATKSVAVNKPSNKLSAQHSEIDPVDSEKSLYINTDELNGLFIVQTNMVEQQTQLNMDQKPMDFASVWASEDNALKVSATEPASLTWMSLSRKGLMLGRWSIEMGADANQTGLVYRAKNEYSNYIHKNYFDRMNSGEFALSASRVQGALLYQLNPKHSLKLGLAYAENRTLQQFDFRDSMPATVIQGQKSDALGYYPIFGYLGLGPQVSFQSRSTYTMLSIPMGYTGHFPWKKGLMITPEVLVSANRLGVAAGAQTLDYQTLLQKTQQSDQFRTWVMGMRLAVGVEKRLNYTHAIGLRLNAQSMLSPMYVPNAALQSRGWSAGLSAHYSWRIQ
ncbi:MAG: hypothetical protein FJ333_06525 [Sphingomonadales bacterium]|nr:hypothetical protein [Sphingomonadales bacterium]